MNGQIDSLDHIESLLSNSAKHDRDTNKSQLIEEESYRLINSQDAGHASFAASSRISQIVDPEFRPPASHSSTASAYSVSPPPNRSLVPAIHSSSYSNDMFNSFPSNSNLGPYVSPVLQSQQQQRQMHQQQHHYQNSNMFQPQGNPQSSSYSANTISLNLPRNDSDSIGLLPPNLSSQNQQSNLPSFVNQAFGSSNVERASFADLAKQPNSGISTIRTMQVSTMTSTLSEYGPSPRQGFSPQQFSFYTQSNEYHGSRDAPRDSNLNTRSNEAPGSTSWQSNQTSFAQRPSELVQCRGERQTSGTRYEEQSDRNLSSSADNGDNEDERGSSASRASSAMSIESTDSNNKDTTLTEKSIKEKNRDHGDKKDGQANQPQPSTSTSSKNPRENLARFNELFEQMGLIDLKNQHRKYEDELDIAKRERYRSEKAITELRRNAHGRNIEMDPTYRQKKDEMAKISSRVDEINAIMKKIKDKCLAKYGHRIAEKEKPPPLGPKKQPLVRQRAKMSTTPRTPQQLPPTRTEKLSALEFDFDDTNTWCQHCDEHFDSVKEFCEHLHKREHLNNMPKGKPWNHTKKNPIDRDATYNHLRSICDKISNEHKIDNVMKEYESVLSPKKKENEIKRRIIERERRIFSRDDPMFKMKGYNYFVPFFGIYCTICERKLFDQEEAEKHLKGYDHSLKHATIVALDPTHDRQFTEKFHKSYVKEYGEPDRSSISKEKTGQQSRLSKPSDPPTVTKTINLPPAAPAPITKTKPPATALPIVSLTPTITISSSETVTADIATVTTTASSSQYKKKTSHIVDNHDIVVEKFGLTTSPLKANRSKRPVTGGDETNEDSDVEDIVELAKAKKLSSHRLESKTSPKKVLKKRVPDIMPVGEGRVKPAALKRLRTERISSLDGYKRPPRIEAEVYKSTKGTRRILDSDEETDAEAYSDDDDDDDDNDETHMDVGDPESPFPEYRLAVTGNIHLHMLKCPKLTKRVLVSMNRINLDDYKDMLLEPEDFWSRVNNLVAKKERGNLAIDPLLDLSLNQATYITQNGKHVPVDLGESDCEGTGKMSSKKNTSEHKSSRKSISPGKKESPKRKSAEDSIRFERCGSSNSEEEVEKDKPRTLDFLHDFFCEKN